MGKKAKLYVVVLINLVAWGYVGYKVYSALQGDDEITFSGSSEPIKKMDEAVKEEEIHLALNYPDPFLKDGNFSNARSGGSKTSGTSPKTHSVKPVPTVIKSTATPTAAPTLHIKYLGLLKNNDKGTQTAMLTVNDRSVFARQHDVIEGYTVLEINPDITKIKKGKEVLTISK